MKDIISYVLSAVAGIVMVGAIVMLIRNQLVYRYRDHLLGQISVASQHDIDRGDFQRWPIRYATLQEIQYQEMVWKFWKPMVSFYGPDRLRTMTEDPSVRMH